MAKLLLLPLCLCICQALRAQDYRSTDIATISIPRKLEFRKADFGWNDRPNFFAKRFNEDDDSVQSVVYLGPPKEDSINLNLPTLKPDADELSCPDAAFAAREDTGVNALAIFVDVDAVGQPQ